MRCVQEEVVVMLMPAYLGRAGRGEEEAGEAEEAAAVEEEVVVASV